MIGEKKQIRAKWTALGHGIHESEAILLELFRLKVRWENTEWTVIVNGNPIGSYMAIDAAKLAAETAVIRLCHLMINSLADVPPPPSP